LTKIVKHLLGPLATTNTTSATKEPTKREGKRGENETERRGGGGPSFTMGHYFS